MLDIALPPLDDIVNAIDQHDAHDSGYGPQQDAQLRRYQPN
jgi:hypothetical protein